MKRKAESIGEHIETLARLERVTSEDLDDLLKREPACSGARFDAFHGSSDIDLCVETLLRRRFGRFYDASARLCALIAPNGLARLHVYALDRGDDEIDRVASACALLSHRLRKGIVSQNDEIYAQLIVAYLLDRGFVFRLDE